MAARFSPDDRWVAFQAATGSIGRIYVVATDALRRSPPPETWIAISDSEGWNDKPRWSPDGNLLYFVSERDGFRCVWVQRLDPATKHPSGAPVAVRHFHSSRLSLKNVDYSLLEMSITRDGLYLNAGEHRGYLGGGDAYQQ